MQNKSESAAAMQTAIVTGGAVRVGRALVEALLQRGTRVVVHYGQSETAARELVDLARQNGREAVAVQADLAGGQAAARQLFAAAQRAFGTIDILINSAAIFEPAGLAETTEDQVQRHLRINLEAPLFLCQCFAESLPTDRTGHIINIVDWRAERPPPGHLAYTLSKAGLVALTKMLAQELAPRIQVNAIAPGAILPPPGAGSDYEQRLRERVPLRRMGGTAAVVGAAAYLLESRFVTGEVLSVTGGEQL